MHSTSTTRGWTADRRFWFYVGLQRTDECWVWRGCVTDGYGRLTANGRSVRAHRFAWELFNGKIPDRLTIDHLCRNRACVNPAHMEIVTNRTNVLRGEGITAKAARATTCPQGHPYSGHNLYVRPNGHRICRTCNNASGRRYRRERAIRGGEK